MDPEPLLSLLELIRRGRLIAVQADYADPISLVLNGEPRERQDQDTGKEGARADDQ